MHQSSTRFVFVFVFFCAQVSLYGQVKEIEAAVKQIDTDVMATLKLKPSDTISVPGTDADIIAAGAIHPDISGFFYDGKLQRIDAKYMGDAGKRWLISYYFSGDSLIYLNSEYAEALINIDDDFYVVQYRNAHYFKNGAPFYRNAEGSAAKAPEAYKDPLRCSDTQKRILPCSSSERSNNCSRFHFFLTISASDVWKIEIFSSRNKQYLYALLFTPVSHGADLPLPEFALGSNRTTVFIVL